MYKLSDLLTSIKDSYSQYKDLALGLYDRGVNETLGDKALSKSRYLTDYQTYTSDLLQDHIIDTENKNRDFSRTLKTINNISNRKNILGSGFMNDTLTELGQDQERAKTLSLLGYTRTSRDNSEKVSRYLEDYNTSLTRYQRDAETGRTKLMFDIDQQYLSEKLGAYQDVNSRDSGLIAGGNVLNGWTVSNVGGKTILTKGTSTATQNSDGTFTTRFASSGSSSNSSSSSSSSKSSSGSVTTSFRSSSKKK